MHDQSEMSHPFSSTSSLNHPPPWSTRNFRQTDPKRLTTIENNSSVSSTQKCGLEEMKNQWINKKKPNYQLKSIVPQHYNASSTRYNPALLQWPHPELLMPRGISLVTEKRLLARAEALHQRNQTGISAVQPLPTVEESIALKLYKKNLNNKKGPWVRAIASEPQLISQNRRGTNVRYRLAAKAPIHYNSGTQSKLALGLGTAERSSTAADFAWYKNSRVSDVWK